MKETNDKIVQEYIDRAKGMVIVRGFGDVDHPHVAMVIVEIAKMIQIQDIHTSDYSMPKWLKDK